MSVTLTYSSLDLYQSFADPALLLVSPDGTHLLDMLSYGCGTTQTMVDSGVTFTLEDSASSLFPGSSICPDPFASAYQPAHYTTDPPSADNFPSPGPGSSGYSIAGDNNLDGDGTGSGTFANTFGSLTGGAPNASGSLNGTWKLYAVDQGDDDSPTVIGSWSLTFVVTGANAATATTLQAGSPNPSFTSGSNDSVSFSAHVEKQDNSGPATNGTVTLHDATTNTDLVTSSIDGSGDVTLTAIITSEGTHSLYAVYNGGTGFAASQPSNTENQTVANIPSNPSGTTFCNGPITMKNASGSLDGTGGSPFPSLLVLNSSTLSSGAFAALSGTIEDVTVTLNGLQVEQPNFMGLMLAGPNGHSFEFMSWADGDGPGGDGLTNTTVWLADNGSGLLQTNSSQESCTQGSPCLPADDYSEDGSLYNDTFPSPAPTATGKAYPTGSSTFTTEFGGSGATGTWQLYMNNWLTENVSTNGSLPFGQLGSWCLNFTMQSNAHPTTTTGSGSPNPATFATGNSTAPVTLTANVSATDGSGTVNEGSVTFVDGATNLGTASVVGGQATTAVSLAEGTHQITATFSNAPDFGDSTAIFDVRVDQATTATGSGAGPYQYCNAGSITAPGLGLDAGAAAPYPSNILVSGLPGTVNSATVTLNNFTTHDQGDLMSLLVGPNGTHSSSNLEFLSLTGSDSDTVLSPVNLNFSDLGSTFSSLGGSGTYKPESYNTNITYPQCPPNAHDCGTENVGPPLGSNPTFTPANKAATTGSSTFAAEFGGQGANGTWSLYIDDGGPTGGGETTTIAGGWCVNFNVNLPSISFSGPTASSFTQGGAGSLPAVTITNNGVNGAGSIGDPAQTTANAMTVTDTLPTGLTYASVGSGSTDWSCSAVGQVVTCTNKDTVAFNGSYSPLTINVSASNTLSGAIGNNTVAVSDTQAASNPASQTGAVFIDVPPAITSGNSAIFTAGVPGTFTVTTTGYPTPALSETGTILPAGVTFTDNGNGTATLAGTTTVAGTFAITIKASNGISPDATQSFTLTVSPAAASSMTANSGTTPQMTTVGTAFPNPLAVTVTDSFGNPIPGFSVTFTAPSSGASGTFSNTTGTITATTNGSGVASEVFTANSTYSDTPYTVTASGNSLSASFTLTNVIANILWIGNPAGGGTTSAILATGVPVGSSASGHGGVGVAVDSAGDVWSLDEAGNTMTEFTAGGTKLGISGGGLSAATSVAIDGSNQVWTTNTGGTISVFNPSGAVTPTTGYTVGTSSPTSIAIDISGNVWIANNGNGSVTKVLGAATPTLPLATGVAAGTPAAKP
jgi:hypothetical protein